MCFWIIVIIFLVALLILAPVLKISEGYGRQGVPSVPMNIPIPPHSNRTNNMNFISYDKVDLKTLCPNAGGPGKWCASRKDCGPAELCYNSAYGVVIPKENGGIPDQAESNYCSCSIQSTCLEDAVC